jgi:hypothetical protein
MSDAPQVDTLFSLSSLNKFTQETNLPAPFIATAFQVICSTSVLIEINLGQTNPLYYIDENGVITFQTSNIAGNLNKNSVVLLNGTTPISILKISLVQPTPVNNTNVYDITLRLLYI